MFFRMLGKPAGTWLLRVRRVCVLGALLLGSHGAWASGGSCSPIGGASTNVFLNTVSIQNSLPIGTQIATQQAFYQLSCSNGIDGAGWRLEVTNATSNNVVQLPDGSHAWRLDNGIGLRITGMTGTSGLEISSLSAGQYGSLYTTTSGSFGPMSLTLKYDLVVIGSLSPGNHGYYVPTWNYRVVDQDPNGSITPVIRAGPNLIVTNLSVVTPSCAVDSSSISQTIQMGNRAAATFSGVGTTSPQQDVKVRLRQCNGAQISISLEPTTPVVGLPEAGTFALNPGGATGVGIQMLYADGTTLFPLNQFVSVGTAGSPGAPADFTVEMKARYIQTAASVTPGVANGALQFTMDYQ